MLSPMGVLRISCINNQSQRISMTQGNNSLLAEARGFQSNVHFNEHLKAKLFGQRGILCNTPQLPSKSFICLFVFFLLGVGWGISAQGRYGVMQTWGVLEHMVWNSKRIMNFLIEKIISCINRRWFDSFLFPPLLFPISSTQLNPLSLPSPPSICMGTGPCTGRKWACQVDMKHALTLSYQEDKALQTSYTISNFNSISAQNTFFKKIVLVSLFSN